MQLINPTELAGAASPEDYLYALMDAYLNFIEQNGDSAMERLNDEQHTLLAYCYLDSQVQEGGFIQLITAGYGDYIFANPLADSLRRWRIKPTPKIIDQARTLYEKHGAEIETLAETETPLDTIRAQFPAFEELDGDYYDAAETDMAAATAYVQEHLTKFIEVK